jgi:hypothetical protein
VLSRKLHARMAVLRLNESGRGAVDLLQGDFWGLILGRQSAHFRQYNTQISEHATANYCMPRVAITLCPCRRVLAILLFARRNCRKAYSLA